MSLYPIQRKCKRCLQDYQPLPFDRRHYCAPCAAYIDSLHNQRHSRKSRPRLGHEHERTCVVCKAVIRVGYRCNACQKAVGLQINTDFSPNNPNTFYLTAAEVERSRALRLERLRELWKLRGWTG